MVKYVAHMVAAVAIGYYAYRTIRKALDEKPDEARCYSSSTAAIMDGAEDWFMDTEGGEWRWDD